MAHFRVSSFENRKDLFADSPEELADLLLQLRPQFTGDPVLINVYNSNDRVLILGLGAPMSTLQCVDKPRGLSIRAISDISNDEDMEFNYQGEATYVSPQYLIPEDAAIKGAIAWIAKDELIPEIRWRSGPFPKKR